MNIVRLLLIIGIILLNINPVYGQESEPKGVQLSLNEVLQVAVLNNFDIQLALYDRLIKETDIDKEMSIYDTVLTLSADYNYEKAEKASSIFGKASHSAGVEADITKKLVTGTDVTLNFKSRRDSSESPFATLNPAYESILEMKFTHPLMRNFFGMNDYGNVMIAKIDVNNYSSEVLDRIEGYLADVEKAYWNAATSLKLVEIREDACKIANDFYHLNVKKKEIGTSEPTDLLAAEANMEQQRSALKVEDDNLKAAINKLKLLINHPQIDEVVPADAMRIPGWDASFVNCLRVAFEARRDYVRAKKDIRAKNIKFGMKKNARWPQLDLEGSLKLNGVGKVWKNTAEEAFKEDNPEFYTKAIFSFPFEDRKGRSEYDKAKHQKAKALLNLKKVEKSIVTEVDDKVRRVNVYRERAEKLERIKELQKNKLEEEQRQFERGRSDSDQIIRFQEDLLNAKIRVSNALKDYKYSLIDLYLTQDIYLKMKGLTI